MSFLESVRTCLKKYATISGRASRAEFWWFQVFISLIPMLIISITLVFMAYAYYMQLQGEKASEILGFAFFASMMALAAIAQISYLAFLVPNICVLIRRFHDTGHSGYEILYGLIPMVGVIYCLVLCCLPSDEGTNQYGPNPCVMLEDKE